MTNPDGHATILQDVLDGTGWTLHERSSTDNAYLTWKKEDEPRAIFHSDEVKYLAQLDWASLVPLGPFVGFWDKGKSSALVSVRSGGPMGLRRPPDFLRRVAGADDEALSWTVKSQRAASLHWLDSADTLLHGLARAGRGMPPHMRRDAIPALELRGIAVHGITQVVAAVEQITDSLFFKTAYCAGLDLALARRRERLVGPIRRRRLDAEPGLRADLDSAYPRAELSLYNAARATIGQPQELLRYFLLYQVLESSFARFVRSDQIRRIKTILVSPEYSPHSDKTLEKLSAVAGPRSVSEREQLKTTIAHCTTSEHFWGFVDDTPGVGDDLSSKDIANSLGVSPIQRNDGNVLVAIANRVYDLRCAIVHAKSDHGDGVRLLPTSPEARRLRADLLLVEYLAQAAIICSATRLD